MSSAFLTQAFIAFTHVRTTESLRLVREHIPDVQVVVAGDIPPEEEERSCRRLYAQMLNLAISDWVQHQNSLKPEKRRWAQDAYHWLFEENKDSLEWAYRTQTKMLCTSFLAICELLYLDPEQTRAKIRKLTKEDLRRVAHSEHEHESEEEHVPIPRALAMDFPYVSDPLFDE